MGEDPLIPTETADWEMPCTVDPSGRRLFKAAPRDRKWLASLATSLAIHTAVIAGGLAACSAYQHYEPPQLVLPVGWASEFEGSGEAGATSPLLREPPLTLEAPPAAEEPSAKSLLGPPPTEFQPPEPATPTVTIGPDRGTGEGLIAGPSRDASPPRFAARTPPGLSDSAGAATGVPAAESQQVASGRSTAGAGTSTGGGPQGVPDGLPAPSFKNRLPAYPREAQSRNWTGTVYLELDLDATGRVVAVRLIRSSGYDVLDRAAIEQAKSWTYTPATVNGQPVPVTLPIPVNFTLR